MISSDEFYAYLENRGYEYYSLTNGTYEQLFFVCNDIAFIRGFSSDPYAKDYPVYPSKDGKLRQTFYFDNTYFQCSLELARIMWKILHNNGFKRTIHQVIP